MLGYPPCFSCGGVGFSYIVEKRSLTVVDVTHNRNYGSTGNKAFNFFNRIRLFFEKHFFRRLFGFVFEFYTESRRYQSRGIVID